MTLRYSLILRTEPPRINSFFNFIASLRVSVGIILLPLIVGCQTDESPTKPENREKEVATLRLHMEENELGIGVGSVEIIRSNPIKITVQKTAVVDEGDIAKAKVVDSQFGGHLIQIEYTRRGKLSLQMATAPRPGRRVAVWSRWTEGRWLAAPVVQRGIEDGIFAFTPDCTREEAERIVRGLNNVAIKLKNQSKPPKPPSDKAKKVKPTDEEEMFK